MSTIRPATDQDAAALSGLLAQLGYPTPTTALPARLHALRESGAVTLVAETEGKVVGMGTVHLVAAITHSTPIAQLTSLAVLDTARGNGVGRELVEALEAWAVAKGCERIIVTTALHRERAHGFYEKNGYEFTGRRYAKVLGPNRATVLR